MTMESLVASSTREVPSVEVNLEERRANPHEIDPTDSLRPGIKFTI